MRAFGERRTHRCRKGWRYLDAGLLAVLLVVSAVVHAADSPLSKEYQIKAAFLYHFTKFVEWPPRSFQTAADPIVIGVLGHATLAAELERVVWGRRVGGRAIAVKHLEAPQEARSMHMLFVPAAQETQLSAILAAADGNAVLIVGESPLSVQAGGIIGFVLRGDKVRFEINVDSAQRAGIRISAQLQKLATTVLKSS